LLRKAGLLSFQDQADTCLEIDFGNGYIVLGLKTYCHFLERRFFWLSSS
jgi:hypothetical protein